MGNVCSGRYVSTNFVYESRPGRVVFGTGTLMQSGAEAERLGISHALILSTPRQQDRVAQLERQLGGRVAAMFSGARMHTPVEVTEQAMQIVADHRVDGLIAMGGGSTIGLSKAIALRTDLPQIALPTTYAGSEMTPILGQTEGGRKTTQRNPRVLPETVIYDVALTLALPVKNSILSGFNALAHAAEALYARDGNPVTALMAREGIAALVRALPAIARAAAGMDGRTDALLGAWLCGSCLGTVGMAIHHQLCHLLGGRFELPHAETHAILLPYSLAYNAKAAPAALAAIAEALGVPEAASGLFRLGRALDVPPSLAAIGMPEQGIDQIADLAIEHPYWNPRPLERAAIRALLARAWAGEGPQID